MAMDHAGFETAVSVPHTSATTEGAKTVVDAESSSAAPSEPEQPAQKQTRDDRPIFIIVMGVAGTGKTTLARALNAELGLPYVEGDDLHPQSNIDKMSRGIPLTDEDREPWLRTVRTEGEKVVKEQVLGGVGAVEEDPEVNGKEEIGKEGKPKRRGVMITCSSLKRSYRSILRGTSTSQDTASSSDLHLPTYFVYIKEDVPLLRERIANRQNHFMKAGMLDSQLQTLESPEGEDGVVVVPLNAPTEVQVQKALEGLEQLVGPLR